MAEVVGIERNDSGPLKVSRKNGVMYLEFAAPPAHVLSLETIGLLHARLDEARADADVSVVVLCSSGKVFCSGHDLKEMRAHRGDNDGGRAFLEELFRRCAEMMKAIPAHPKPVIAAVDGIATAAGCQLVASCDLAIASDRATFCTPGVNLGGFCSTPMVALSRNLTPKHAMEMLLTGEMVDAAAARDFGLVNRVVPPEYLNQVVRKYAETIASKSSSAIAYGKRAFYRQLEMPLAQAYDFASEIMVEGFLTDDACEGMTAFLEKRDPKWTGD
ncbi:MAG: enoyl-CoA hydratase [Rhizobiaceae bacterium]